MEKAKKVYQHFVKKYPDIFKRRDAIGSWCIKCRKLSTLSAKVWKLLNMSEDD